ncbi:hypothetical protein IFM89_011850 [Coptis chinensis]|uniref:Uncharacterized protein n=1 Tax=Coptis chinensis TaxID=261450 RepID=A0A835LXN2_9MAGN|nr:hypothetical protein IFM89_011850 [Coptis chinensis]
MEGEIPVQLLCFVDILIPNETELERLIGMPTRSFVRCQVSFHSFVLILFVFSQNYCDVIAAAANISRVQIKGAIPSMPERKTILDALQSL